MQCEIDRKHCTFRYACSVKGGIVKLTFSQWSILVILITLYLRLMIYKTWIKKQTEIVILPYFIFHPVKEILSRTIVCEKYTYISFEGHILHCI